MSEPPAETGVRASDAERRDVAEALQRHHAAGRLTLTELDERLTAAYAARIRDELAALLADLPADPTTGPMTGPEQGVGAVDPGVLCAVWCLCPPAGLAYWLYTRRARRRLLGGARR